MQAAAEESFNGTFLKTMLMGIKLGASSEKMSCRGRKRAIKLSANIAMAVASKDMNWSRALIARHAKHGRNRDLVRSLLGPKRYESVTKPSNFPSQRMAMMIRRRVGRNPLIRRGANAPGATASVIAKSMVRKRTRILKRLVPGGESMDDLSLLGETIDYVISLQAQVNLMRLLTEVFGVSKPQPT
ncbi:hypothetical protein KSP39_PZI020938 [Platanthera zijinensis]|uniref:IBH1-like N-terminal domain-containing protein n=1 Tax=Platanthera zijinensis TaxID=2320716 RepID=A0AAP0AZF2_9ASPA